MPVVVSRKFRLRFSPGCASVLQIHVFSFVREQVYP
jgi:hypothetical protein